MPLLAVLAAVLVTTACNRADRPNSGSAEKTRGADAAMMSTAGDAEPSQTKASPEVEAVKHAVSLWNEAHNQRDSSAFPTLYADSVFFYGRQQSGRTCAASKQALFAKNPDFRQAIVGGVRVGIHGTDARATFTKHVTILGKATDYPSYLELTKTDAGWKITLESDDVTDANLRKAMRLDGHATVQGDWDGDGQRESARMSPPVIPHEDEFECTGPCNCTLVFDKLPSLTIENCLGGTPVNEGDLDGDGTDELGLLPDWWISCWRSYYVFGLRHGKWVQVVGPISTHCSQWEAGVDVVAKDEKNPGHVIIRSTDMADFKVKAQSVPVRTQ